MAKVVSGLIWALVLAACGPVQQPETAAPFPDSSQPEAATPEPAASEAATPEAAAPAGSSVLDGVFTARQASGGETSFQQVCAACHSITEFRGGRFRLAWAGLTVGDLFQSISTLMPKDDPGVLSPEEYLAIISYLLRENGYPAGEEDLPTDTSALRYIRIVAGA